MAITTSQIAHGGLDRSVIAGLEGVNPFAKTLYVQSTHRRAGDTGRSGKRVDLPLKTVAKAIANAVAGDTIIVGPGHVETISKAGGWTIAKDDISIIGLGNKTQRPVITVDTLATANAVVTGKGALIRNTKFVAGFDGVASLLSLQAAGAVIDNCMTANTSSAQCGTGIILNGNADDCEIVGLEADHNTAGSASSIQYAGSDRLVIRGSRMYGDFLIGCIRNVTTACVDGSLDGNFLQNDNASDNCITLVAASTGVISNNRCRIVTNTASTFIVAAGCDWFENYGVNQDGTTGKLIGTLSSWV